VLLLGTIISFRPVIQQTLAAAMSSLSAAVSQAR
jgi:hypothetical protein